MVISDVLRYAYLLPSQTELCEESWYFYHNISSISFQQRKITLKGGPGPVVLNSLHHGPIGARGSSLTLLLRGSDVSTTFLLCTQNNRRLMMSTSILHQYSPLKYCILLRCFQVSKSLIRSKRTQLLIILQQ